MIDMAEALAEFHGAFPDDKQDAPELRPTLHKEEHRELLEALESGDRHQIARELADVLYIAFGTAYVYEIDLDAAFREVHRANMEKLRPNLCPECEASQSLLCGVCDGNGYVGPPWRREDGKIMKPDRYRPPNMRRAVA